MSAFWVLVGAWMMSRYGWPSVLSVAATILGLDVAAAIIGTESARQLGAWTRQTVGWW